MCWFTSNTRRCGLACLPLILMFLSLSTFVTTYLISFYHHNTSWFPTISDTADKPPESNVFGLLFNFCAALSFLVIFIRYLQLRHDVDWSESDRQLLLVVNKVSVAFGAISSLGACIVANFQEDEVIYVHITGAGMVFIGGILYCWIQSFISYKMKSCGLITPMLLMLRVILATLMSIFFISCVTALFYANAGKEWFIYHQLPTHGPHRHKWSTKDKHYLDHVIGDVSEWLMALTLLGFMATFFGEFRFVKMKIMVSRCTQTPVPLVGNSGSDEGLYSSLYV
ncbi:DNA damage-regulated autophagy modulator protein 2-like [Acropora palmata]